MNKQQFRTLLDDVHRNLVNLTATKGEEYSGDADQLSNFKRQAAELGMEPEKVLMVYLSKHLDAIKSYTRTKKEFSEPIEGRINDAILYLILLTGLISDRRSELNPPTDKMLSGGIHPTAPQSQDEAIPWQQIKSNGPQAAPK